MTLIDYLSVQQMPGPAKQWLANHFELPTHTRHPDETRLNLALAHVEDYCLQTWPLLQTSRHQARLKATPAYAEKFRLEILGLHRLVHLTPLPGAERFYGTIFDPAGRLIDALDYGPATFRDTFGRAVATALLGPLRKPACYSFAHGLDMVKAAWACAGCGRACCGQHIVTVTVTIGPRGNDKFCEECADTMRVDAHGRLIHAGD